MDDTTARPADRYAVLARHEERVRRERRAARAAAVRQAAVEARRPSVSGRRSGALDALVPPREPAPAPPAPAPAPASASARRATSLDDFADSAIAVVHPRAGEEVDLDLCLGPPPAATPAVRAPRGPLAGAAEDHEGAAVPDTVLDCAEQGPCTVRAVSVRGAAARRRGVPRGDALCVAPCAGGLLLAVARGAGPRAHLGAQEACRLALAHAVRESAALTAALRARDATAFRGYADRAVASIGAVLAHTAQRAGRPPEAYASSLRVLYVPTLPGGGVPGLYGVGEGSTALLREGLWDTAPGAGGAPSPLLPGAERAGLARLLEPLRPGDVLGLGTAPLDPDRLTREYLATAWGEGPPPEPAELLRQIQHRTPYGTGEAEQNARTGVVLWHGAGRAGYGFA